MSAESNPEGRDQDETQGITISEEEPTPLLFERIQETESIRLSDLICEDLSLNADNYQ